ncbi:putative cytochrome P450 [Corynespora cassiicola Philippines]|uniref:Putative cytochrome P450 n=1 Tax=Corynespora cassiicola Philippines TaxID=1448308 RepID=A0A2T2NGA3_CORCC|nr:putative cytochrome P450 [Corynespora cassiicola Philippines]
MFSAWAGDFRGMVSHQQDQNVILNVFLVTITILFIYKLLRKSKPYAIFPVWATIEVALTSHLLLPRNGLGHHILSLLRRNNGSLFGFTSKHQVLVNLPDVDRLMSHSSRFLDATPIQYTLITRVFGGVDTPEFKKKSDASFMDLKGPVERLFLNETAAAAALERACIPEHVKDFVTFSSERRHMKRWEHSAQTKVIKTTKPGDKMKVEANLQSLTRDFGASIAIPQLYGSDFFERYQRVLDDLWKFDNDLFPLLMIGVPSWAPLKIVREGLAARTRLLSEIEALYKRIDQYQNDLPVDFGADMSDVSETALGRNRLYAKYGWSMPERGFGDLGLLWGQNANTQPVLFWLLAYVYSTTGVLKQIREEIDPFLGISKVTPRELTALDIPGLSKNCQLLKACIFETYRLVNEPTSIRQVARSMTIKDGHLSHELKPGMFVSAALSIDNRDASVYENPDKFDPSRFLEPDPSSGKLVARYGKMKPWGSGAAICKGRTFAEKEIIALSAAIISMWDIAPANGTWEFPSMVPGTGVRKPTKDIRVVVSRR